MSEALVTSKMMLFGTQRETSLLSGFDDERMVYSIDMLYIHYCIASGWTVQSKEHDFMRWYFGTRGAFACTMPTGNKPPTTQRCEVDRSGCREISLYIPEE